MTHAPIASGALDRLGQKLDDSELGKAASFIVTETLVIIEYLQQQNNL